MAGKTEMTGQTEKEKIRLAMEAALPAYFKLNEQDLYADKTLYNEISKGTGPPITKIGGRSYLERSSFLNWAFNRGNTLHRPGRKRAVKGGVAQN